MSWYTDGVADGKSEKFDELMVEINALRKLLARCTAYILDHTTDGVVRSQLFKDIKKEEGK